MKLYQQAILLELIVATDRERERKKTNKKVGNEKVKTARLDLMFLILFPCIFLIFNIVYWVGFLYIVPKGTGKFDDFNKKHNRPNLLQETRKKYSSLISPP